MSDDNLLPAKTKSLTEICLSYAIDKCFEKFKNARVTYSQTLSIKWRNGWIWNWRTNVRDADQNNDLCIWKSSQLNNASIKTSNCFARRGIQY